MTTTFLIDKVNEMFKYEIKSFNFTENEFVEHFLPCLVGQVFHFTKSSSWMQIQKCGYIDTNSESKYKATSLHSHESLGRHLKAVCLFDLRKQSKEIFSKDLILYDFFMRRWRPTPFYLILLSSELYPKLTTSDNVNAKDLEGKMYIPKIESWHVGKLSLESINKVYQITIL